MDVSLWLWALFTVGVLAVLLVDVLVFHRRAHEVTPARGRPVDGDLARARHRLRRRRVGLAGQ